MDYTSIVDKINSYTNGICFSSSDSTEIQYLIGLNLSQDILDFYRSFNPIDIIEINRIRLLPIKEIINENNDFTPGYLLTPLGCCVIASTDQGDVYCIRKSLNNYNIILASHDEISEGMQETEIFDSTRLITHSFYDFLKLFIEKKLVASYYDLE